ncbi:MAG: protein kinase [Blastocatellia bacterium]|nr:protein kinase [Blastocatellia bacterium]
MRHCLLCSRQYADAMQYCPHDGTALPPPDNLVGKILDGKYRIEALHGSGGMGAVYRATQVNLERTVALKVVRGDFLKDAIVTERFKREALAVARLKHPHIVTVYDFGIVQDGGAYLVMEFLEGRTLRIEIQNRSKLPVGPAVDIMRQICSAVHAAHTEGIIHRDLKPDNIFLESTRDGSVLVKILDFGVAKLRQNTADLARSADLTMSGMMLGTPIYMSPEQCQGEPFDARSDIYSLGCVFYEMVAGRPPFLGNSPSALIIKHASEAPEAADRPRADDPAGSRERDNEGTREGSGGSISDGDGPRQGSRRRLGAARYSDIVSTGGRPGTFHVRDAVASEDRDRQGPRRRALPGPRDGWGSPASIGRPAVPQRSQGRIRRVPDIRDCRQRDHRALVRTDARRPAIGGRRAVPRLDGRSARDQPQARRGPARDRQFPQAGECVPAQRATR